MAKIFQTIIGGDVKILGKPISVSQQFEVSLPKEIAAMFNSDDKLRSVLIEREREGGFKIFSYIKLLEV